MVEYKDSNLDQVFHALADKTRRSLLLQMSKGPLRVTELAENYDISLNAVSKHIKVLEKASLVTRSIEGRVHFCSPNPKELKKAELWLEAYQKFWTLKLDKLEDFVNKKSKKRREK